MTVQVGSWRRSFFLASIAVRNSPCNFKRNVDRSAEKREQQYDLFKRHGASPLSALKRPGERDFKKNLFTRRAQVPVRRKLQQRRPLPAAEAGRSCWGRGQQDASAVQGTKRMLGAATRTAFIMLYFSSKHNRALQSLLSLQSPVFTSFSGTQTARADTRPPDTAP